MADPLAHCHKFQLKIIRVMGMKHFQLAIVILYLFQV